MTVLIRTATLPIPITAMNAVVYESFIYFFFPHNVFQELLQFSYGLFLVYHDKKDLKVHIVVFQIFHLLSWFSSMNRV